MILGIALVVSSFAAGVWFGMIWNGAIVEASKVTHKRQMDEIWEEVKRLRAQNAQLIGKQ